MSKGTAGNQQVTWTSSWKTLLLYNGPFSLVGSMAIVKLDFGVSSIFGFQDMFLLK